MPKVPCQGLGCAAKIPYMCPGRERSRAAIIANMLIFCLVEVEHGEGLDALDIL